MEYMTVLRNRGSQKFRRFLPTCLSRKNNSHHLTSLEIAEIARKLETESPRVVSGYLFVMYAALFISREN